MCVCVSSGLNYLLNLRPKVGSSPIGCEDLDAPRGITNGDEGIVQPQKGHGKAKKNKYYKTFVRYP